MAEQHEPRVLAAVDLGSNSFHMVVARHEHGHLTLVDRLREMVRLADGLDDEQNLTNEVRQRALDCLSRFGERLDAFHPNDVVAVGTNTLRKARNGAEFLLTAKAHLGHTIDIISGLEEARLVYLGASHSVPSSRKRRLIVDIGGGSTELVVGQGYEAQRMYSLFMGCVSISREFFPNGKVTRKQYDKAKLAVDLEIAPVIEPLKDLGWRRAFGTSGTARSIARILHELDDHANEITPLGMRTLRRQILKNGGTEGLPWQSLQERRQPVFMGGLLILERVFKALGVESMTVADYSLREGLLYDILGKWSGEDARERSVNALARNYDADRAQAQRLWEVALSLFKQVNKDWRLPSGASKRLLRWASSLHEIGLGIAHSHYHRHGAYIVANADLAGFSIILQRRLAWLIEGHRRRIPPLPSMPAKSQWVYRLPRLLAVFRIAVVIVRGRRSDDLPTVKASTHDSVLALKFPAGWLDEHPLTYAGLVDEAEKFGELGLSLEFD